MANQTQHHPAPNVDKPAAYMGLVGAVVFLLIVVVTIVTLTNKKYANEAPEGSAAAATH
jgi:hypothetical protein